MIFQCSKTNLRALSACFLLGLLFVLLFSAPQALAEALPEIRIRGVSGEPLANVSEALRPATDLVGDKDLDTLWLNRFQRQLPLKVERALEPFGYYAPKVEVNIDSKSAPPIITVVIDPGAPVRIATRHLEIVGEPDRYLQERLDRFPLTPGSILRHQAYEKAKDELQALAVDLGYLDANYTRHQITVDRELKTADLELVLNTGPRFRFGEIRLLGGDEYPERFLKRFLLAREGNYFSYRELANSQQRFLNSDRFKNILIVPRRLEAEGELIPVDFQLETKAPKRLRPGLGYGTDTGARVFLRYQDVNALQLGHEFNTDLLVAERQQGLTADYTFPGYRNIDTLLTLRGGYKAEDLATYKTRYVFAEAEQLYGFREGWVGSVFIRLQQESSTISGEDISSGILMPGLRLRLGQLDDPSRPQRGYRLSMEVRGTREGLGSEVSLLQVLAEANVIYPLPGRFYLQLHGSGATSLQENDFDELPASLRFFAGGDRSVRGYAYQSLGPTNAAGEVVGGKHLLVGSIELERRFFENWGVAFFYDAGNAFNNLNDYDLAAAAGFGLHYFTPVGPLRVDLAKTIGGEKTNYRVHIGLGVGW